MRALIMQTSSCLGSSVRWIEPWDAHSHTKTISSYNVPVCPGTFLFSLVMNLRQRLPCSMLGRLVLGWASNEQTPRTSIQRTFGVCTPILVALSRLSTKHVPYQDRYETKIEWIVSEHVPSAQPWERSLERVLGSGSLSSSFSFKDCKWN